jgi:hypothetical protein
MVSRVQEGEQTSESSTGNDTKTEAATGYQLPAARHNKHQQQNTPPITRIRRIARMNSIEAL